MESACELNTSPANCVQRPNAVSESTLGTLEHWTQFDHEPAFVSHTTHLLFDFLGVDLKERSVHPLVVVLVELYRGVPEFLVRLLGVLYLLDLVIGGLLADLQQRLLAIDADFLRDGERTNEM